jgi:hypothetical protein
MKTTNNKTNDGVNTKGNNMKLLVMLVLGILVVEAQAEPRHRSLRNHNYILRRQQVYPGLGVPTSRLIIGRREIDIYRNGMMFERDHLVGVKPR